MSQNWVPIAVIVGWALITLYRMHLAGQARDRLHRERIAMIEKGLVPPPEADPGQFERMMDWHPSAAASRGPRSTRTGIIIIAVGVGLGLMNYVRADDAADVRNGLGVAAFLVVLGIAFLVNAMFESRARQSAAQQPQGKG